MEEDMKNYLKRMTTFILAILMLVSVPLQTFAEVTYNYNNLASNKNDIINKRINKLPVTPARPEENEKAEDYIKNPAQPDIYTLRTDYRTEKGEKFEVSYQPYIASVGEAATPEEKAKVKKEINMPDITGYKKPQENYFINYKIIKEKAKAGIEKGNDTLGKRYKASQSFDYKATEGKIKVKHVFQNLKNFNKYENPNGGKEELITTQGGNTGSTLEVKPLDAKDIMGFVPESAYIKTQVPENTEDFVIEYRYNRNSFDVSYDTDGGSFLANRTLYYGQVMPPIEKLNMPTKKGSSLIGWKPSVELVGEVGGKQTKFKAGEIIKDDKGGPILDLNAKLIMPAGKVKFTAVWEENKKTSYTVLFWAEKSDKGGEYDYIGTHTYNDVDTNMRPDLDNEPVYGVEFSD